MRPRPLSVDSDRFGSTQTNTAPSGAAVRQVGYIAIGGRANTVTSKPGGALTLARMAESAAGLRVRVPLAGVGWAPATPIAATAAATSIDTRVGECALMQAK